MSAKLPSAATRKVGRSGFTAEKIQELVDGNYQQNGQTLGSTVAFLRGNGIHLSETDVVQALLSVGVTRAKIKQYQTDPGLVKRTLDQAGQATLPLPIADIGAAVGADVTAATAAAGGADAAAAEAGAAGGAGGAASNLFKAASQIDKVAGSAALGALVARLEGWNALRIVKLVAGLALAFFGLRQLASVGGGGGGRVRMVPR